MSEWKEYKLGELCNIRRGASPRPIHDYLSEEGMPWVKISDATSENSRFIKKTVQKIKLSGVQKSLKVNPGDFILSNSATPGIPKFMNIEACIHDGWLLLSNFNKIDNLFLYYFLLHERPNLANQGNGSVFTNLKTDIVKNLKINIPDLPTQSAIAEILSSLDDKIELNNKINQELENLAQTLFKQWFIDFEFPNENGETYKSSGGDMVDSEFGEIPKGWEVGYLEDVLEFHNGYAFTSKELESENSKECYHVFKMGHIKKGGGLNAEGTKSYFSKSKAQKLSKYVLKKGDLLMCMTDMKGNVALLGHTALMNEDDKYIVNQRVGLLRPKNDVCIDYPYLYILTNSFDFIEELRSRANSGVQVNLSTNEIKKSKILIAPKSINEKFDLITKSFYDKIFEITNENETLRNTRDFLLPKLISGELVINEINN
jgi:type I restriction enzyme S subunit